MKLLHRAVMRMIDRIFVRCGPKEKAAFEKIAGHRGMTLSVWARMVLRAEAERYSKEQGLAVSFLDSEVSKETGDARAADTTEASES
jgi:hypothetical protein